MAEAISVLATLFSISSYASGIAKAIQGKSTHPRRLSPHCFLEIWDVGASQLKDGNQPPATVPLVSVSNEVQVASALDDLPEQKPDTLRIFLNELDHAALVQYESRVAPTLIHSQREASEEIYSPAGSVEALMSLWRGTFRADWYCLDGWTFLRPTDIAGGSSSKRWKAFLLDISQLVGQPDQRWVTTSRKLRFQETDGHIKAFISCRTSVDRRTSHPCIATERFSLQLRDLESIYQPLRSKRDLKELFLLQYHHANLNMFSDLLLNITWQYAHRRKEAFDPRHSKLRQWNLKAILNDVELYRQFQVIGIELQAAIGLLADLLLDQIEEEAKPEFAILYTELSYRCKDVRVQLDRLTSDLDQDLKFLSLSRDITQSSDVQTLTLLATLFLPLSLAAGVLSMQYRFNELGDRLYDFFGIVVLLVTIVVVILVSISVFNLGLEIESRFRQKDWYRLYVRPPIITTFVLIFLTMGCLTLASLIFGWGVLAAVCAPIALLIVMALLFFFIEVLKSLWNNIWIAVTSLPLGSRRKSANEKSRDPEQNQSHVTENQAAVDHQASDSVVAVSVSPPNA